MPGLLAEREVLSQQDLRLQATQMDGFHHRLLLDRQISEELIIKGERWPECSGQYRDYKHGLVNLRTIGPDLEKKIALLDLTPPTMHDQLSSFIQDIRSIRPNNKPVIALDLGGGAGISWKHAAKQLATEVKNGEVIFVVSNLHWGEEEFIDHAKKQGSHASALAQTEESGVQFVFAPFHKLCNSEVLLPNGEPLRLRGNVDFIHERRSLTSWAQLPERDLLALQGVLSPFGSYFVRKREHPYVYQKDLVNQQQRIQGIRHARKMLEDRYGFKKVLHVEEGIYTGVEMNYVVFRRPSAAPVQI